MSDITEFLGIEDDPEQDEAYEREGEARECGLKREYHGTPTYVIEGATFGGAAVYGYVRCVEWLDENGHAVVTDYVPSLRIGDDHPDFYDEEFVLDLRAEKSMDEAMAAFKIWGKRHGGTRLNEQFEASW